MIDDYEIGYGKPPKHTKFKPGVSPNPKGRKKRSPSALARIIGAVLNAPVAYRERGRVKYATRQELTIKMLVDHAIKGNLAAAEHLLKLRAHGQRFGDAGVQKLLISDWLPDYPGQTAENKTGEFASSRTADAVAWWDEPVRGLDSS